ncbi:hypothetical protein PMAYCL1PPCAC_18128, partial [Pristionchus mayeri]
SSSDLFQRNSVYYPLDYLKGKKSVRMDNTTDDNDDVFLSADFDPEQALNEPISPGGCDDDIYIFEKFLLDQDNSLASLILERAEYENKAVLTKKEEKRRREIRLQNMTTGRNRELFETKMKKKKDTVIEKMEKIKGPLIALASAVTDCRIIEIRCRNMNRVDRVMRGVPVAFDKHWNIILRDVKDRQKPSRSEGGAHLIKRSILPAFARWTKLDPPHSQYRARSLPCSFIKGDTICLVRIL